jgi:hypothetical protein
LPYTRNFIALRVPLLLVYFSLFKRSSAYQFYRSNLTSPQITFVATRYSSRAKNDLCL